MQQALRQVNLAHLAERLDVSCDWSHILSVGEQQRLAFARVLFNRPQVVFLDESTSAMDEGLEHALYSLLRTEMPGRYWSVSGTAARWQVSIPIGWRWMGMAAGRYWNSSQRWPSAACR